jgi:DNA-binding protein HU-beta
VVERSSRQGRNPQTGEPITIDARKSPVFRPGTQLKRSVG